MTPPSPDRKLLTILHARMKAQVSRRTIYNWIDDGKVEYIRTAGGCIRIFEDTLWRPAGKKVRNEKA